MSEETNEIRLSDIEFRVLQILKEDARMPAAKIAKQLSLSRVTVSRVINSLKEKGVKFTIEAKDKELVAFAVTDSCKSAECYKTISGDFISLIRSNTLDEIESELEKIKPKNVILARSLGKRFVRTSLYCDYCGGKIESEPIIYKRSKKIYYACCNACLNGLKKKLTKKE
jgi:DNA-binding Lrp family transcriptional regulator